MNRWRWALVAALTVPFAAAAFPPLPKPKDNKAADKDVEKAIQGRWEVTGVERGALPGKPVFPAGKLTSTMIVTIKGTEMARTLRIKDRELKAAGAKIKLDARKAPAWFDVSSGKGKVAALTMKGLVKVEGDTMTWTYTTGGGERPKKIDGELGERQLRYTLKRVKP
jgi:uncharacterized protein (TIGR03067 family)